MHVEYELGLDRWSLDLELAAGRAAKERACRVCVASGEC